MARIRAAGALRRQPAVPRHPRRVSGPVRPVPVPGRPRPATIAPQPHDSGLGARLLALPDNRWLDMLLRSRAWIWLLGIALGGIVFMQVSLLGMNAGIGEAVQRSADLQHANAALEEQVAELSSGDRVRAQASKLGLLSPDAGTVTFLTVRGALDPGRAAQRMTPPSDDARQTLATDGRPATPVAAVPTAAPTAVPTTAITPVPTTAVTPVPTTAVTPVPTAAATTAPPTTAAGATQAP